MALVFLGCQRPTETAAASPAGVTEAVSNVTASGTRTEDILDPSMNNMKAFSVTIPATWHFRGMVMQQDGCIGGASMVWRASSPDGLSYEELMPRMGWVWGSGPMFKARPGCLPLGGPMSAQDFLKHLAQVMKVEYVADDPVPAEVNARVQKDQRDAEASVAGKYAAMRVRPPKVTVELAQAIVRYKNGSFAMKGEFGLVLTCREQYYTMGGTSTTDQCETHLNYFTSPENQFDALMRVWKAPGMMGHGNEAWQNAYMQRSQQRSDQFVAATNEAVNKQYQASREMANQAAAQRQAQQQNFDEQQASRQRMHNEFMATVQRGTNMSMQQTQAGMNARSTAASDWVDYALDRQTVVDPNTGQLTKASSSYSYTWVDSTGKVGYQTNDSNANPNGVIPGNWTKQQVVHGNGAQ